MTDFQALPTPSISSFLLCFVFPFSHLAPITSLPVRRFSRSCFGHPTDLAEISQRSLRSPNRASCPAFVHCRSRATGHTAPVEIALLALPTSITEVQKADLATVVLGGRIPLANLSPPTFTFNLVLIPIYAGSVHIQSIHVALVLLHRAHQPPLRHIIPLSSAYRSTCRSLTPSPPRRNINPHPAHPTFTAVRKTI